MTMNELHVERFATELARVPLFEHVPPKDLLRLAALVREKNFGRDAVVFQHGQRADCIYIITEGSVKLMRTAPDGRQQILHVVEAPNTFGEAAVFAGGAFPAHAVTLESSKCLVMPRQALLEQLRQYPETSMSLLASMSMRLRHFVQVIEDLSLRDVSSRVARYLLAESQRVGRRRFRLPIAKGELARQMGTSAETLSRTLARLRDQGLVSLEGRTVHLLREEAIEEIVEGVSQ
jgi:CRP/FNR family transcriptional regulator, dissimilatory nitrate respiration regulator